MAAVEFAKAGEGNMVDIHVQAHPDRVGGDQVIHLARLIQLDLRIARSRRQGRRARLRRRRDGGASVRRRDRHR